MLAGLFSIAMVHATTNIEKERDEDDTGLTGGMEAAMSGGFGNVDSLLIEAEGHLAWTRDANHFLLLAGYGFATERGINDALTDDRSLFHDVWQFENRALLHTRIGRDVSKRVRVESFAGAQRDAFLYLQRRLIFGIGTRLKAWDVQRTTGHLGASWMLEDELSDSTVVTEPPQRLYQRASLYHASSWQIVESVDLLLVAYFQPRIVAPQDYRFLGETDFTFEITDRLAFSLEFVVRYDSDPPPVSQGAAALSKWNGSLDHTLELSF